MIKFIEERWNKDKLDGNVIATTENFVRMHKNAWECVCPIVFQNFVEIGGQSGLERRY